jgi:hypothetical protein
VGSGAADEAAHQTRATAARMTRGPVTGGEHSDFRLEIRTMVEGVKERARLRTGKRRVIFSRL